MLWLFWSCTPPVEPPDVEDTAPAVAECDLVLTLSDNPYSPISPLAELNEDQDLEFKVRFWSDEVSPRATRPGSGTQPVFGLRANDRYSLQAVAGDRCSPVVGWETDPLPDDIAPFEVTTPWAHDDDGLIVLLGPAKPQDTTLGPWVIGVDRAGQVVMLFELGIEALGRDVREGPDGSLWVARGKEMRRLSPWGETLDLVERETSFHHDVLPTEHGLLTMLEVDQVHTLDAYGEVTVTGDLLVEFSPTGEELWSWNAFDHLDVQSFDEALVYPRYEKYGYVEWTHGNGMSWGDDGTLVVSMRNQRAVIGIDRDTGDIAWRVDGEDLDSPFWGQHAPLLEDGLLTVFDNLGAETSRVGTWDLSDGSLVWEYDTGAVNETFGSAERMDSGDLLVTAIGQREPGTTATVSQVTASGEVVWGLGGFEGYWSFRGRPLEDHVTVE